MAYWAPIRSLDEARYLCAIINSDTVLQRVIPMQARGWRDPRHFDNLVWELPIPEFDDDLELHRELAAAGAEAESTASAVVLPEGDYRRKRRAIREALASTGLAARASRPSWVGCSMHDHLFGFTIEMFTGFAVSETRPNGKVALWRVSGA